MDELYSVTEIKKRALFDGLIERRWGTSINPPAQKDAEDADNLDDNEFEEYEDVYE